MAAIEWDSRDTVSKLALEVARIAHEGLGHTELQRLRIAFHHGLEQGSSNQEVQIRAVTRLLIAKTRKDSQPKSAADAQIAGLCLMWLANTHVGEWSLLQLCKWGESLPTGASTVA